MRYSGLGRFPVRASLFPPQSLPSPSPTGRPPPSWSGEGGGGVQLLSPPPHPFLLPSSAFPLRSASWVGAPSLLPLTFPLQGKTGAFQHLLDYVVDDEVNISIHVFSQLVGVFYCICVWTSVSMIVGEDAHLGGDATNLFSWGDRNLGGWGGGAQVNRAFFRSVGLELSCSPFPICSTMSFVAV